MVKVPALWQASCKIRYAVSIFVHPRLVLFSSQIRVGPEALFELRRFDGSITTSTQAQSSSFPLSSPVNGGIRTGDQMLHMHGAWVNVQSCPRARPIWVPEWTTSLEGVMRVKQQTASPAGIPCRSLLRLLKRSALVLLPLLPQHPDIRPSITSNIPTPLRLQSYNLQPRHPHQPQGVYPAGTMFQSALLICRFRCRSLLPTGFSTTTSPRTDSTLRPANKCSHSASRRRYPSSPLLETSAD